MVRVPRSAIPMLLPASALFLILLGGPLVSLLGESLRLFVPGRVGAAEDAPFTLANYAELVNWAYLRFFWETLRISFIAALISLALGFLIAHSVARTPSTLVRKLWIGFLISMMFISIIVRVYSLELTFGPVGFLNWMPRMLGLGRSSITMIEIVVVAGLVHFTLPLTALTLVGAIQNINPRLVEAAQALGAPRWKAHLSVTLPLSMRGLLAAFLIAFTLSISGFVIPMILGKGRVLFVSNLIYSRFSEVANYPSGSALSVSLLVLSFIIVYGISVLVGRRLKTAQQVSTS